MVPPPPPPPPSPLQQSKSPAFRNAAELWEKRSSCIAKPQTTETTTPAYPFSPRKTRSSSESVPRKLKKGKKKMYFPASAMLPKEKNAAKAGGLLRTRSLVDEPTESILRTSSSNVTDNNQKVLRKSASCPERKSVQFGQDAVRHIETIDDMAEDAIQDMWWSSRDYVEIKKEYEAVLFLMDTGKDVPPDHSARGLAKRTEEGAWELYENQRNARNAVLCQQDALRKQKKSDPEAIAEAYRQESEKMQKEALEQAQRDAAEVQQYLVKGTTNGNYQRSASFFKANKSPDSPTRHSKAPLTLNDSFANIGALAPRSADGGGQILQLSDNEEIQKFVDCNDSDDDMSMFFGATDHVAEKVRFQSGAVEQITPHKVSDLEKYIKRCWYSREELKQIETEFQPVLQLMENAAKADDGNNGVDVDEGKDSRRGLEKSTEEGTQKLSERRKFATKAVRALQWKKQSAEAIAAAYHKITKEARKEAAKFGKQDAKEAKKYRLKKKHHRSSSSSEKSNNNNVLVPKRSSSNDSGISTDTEGAASATMTTWSSQRKVPQRVASDDTDDSCYINFDVSTNTTDLDSPKEGSEPKIFVAKTPLVLGHGATESGTNAAAATGKIEHLQKATFTATVLKSSQQGTKATTEPNTKAPKEESLSMPHTHEAPKSPLQRKAGIGEPNTKLPKSEPLPTESLHIDDEPTTNGSDSASGHDDQDLSDRSLLDLQHDLSEHAEAVMEQAIVETPAVQQPERPALQVQIQRRRLSGSHAPSLRQMEKSGVVSASTYKKKFDEKEEVDVSWHRKDESAKGHKEIVANIVSSTEIEEPDAKELEVTVVQHVYASATCEPQAPPSVEVSSANPVEKLKNLFEKTTEQTTGTTTQQEDSHVPSPLMETTGTETALQSVANSSTGKADAQDRTSEITSHEQAPPELEGTELSASVNEQPKAVVATIMTKGMKVVQSSEPLCKQPSSNSESGSENVDAANLKEAEAPVTSVTLADDSLEEEVKQPSKAAGYEPKNVDNNNLKSAEHGEAVSDNLATTKQVEEVIPEAAVDHLEEKNILVNESVVCASEDNLATTKQVEEVIPEAAVDHLEEENVLNNESVVCASEDNLATTKQVEEVIPKAAVDHLEEESVLVNESAVCASEDNLATTKQIEELIPTADHLEEEKVLVNEYVVCASKDDQGGRLETAAEELRTDSVSTPDPVKSVMDDQNIGDQSDLDVAPVHENVEQTNSSAIEISGSAGDCTTTPKDPHAFGPNTNSCGETVEVERECIIIKTCLAGTSTSERNAPEVFTDNSLLNDGEATKDAVISNDIHVTSKSSQEQLPIILSNDLPADVPLENQVKETPTSCIEKTPSDAVDAGECPKPETNQPSNVKDSMDITTNAKPKAGWGLRTGFRKLFKKPASEKPPENGLEAVTTAAASASPIVNKDRESEDPGQRTAKLDISKEAEESSGIANSSDQKDQHIEKSSASPCHEKPSESVVEKSSIVDHLEAMEDSAKVPADVPECRNEVNSAISDLSDEDCDLKSKCNGTDATQESTSKTLSVADRTPKNDNKEDQVVWFKARAKDVVTIRLDDGRVMYLMEADACSRMQQL